MTLPKERVRELVDFLWGTVRDPLPDKIDWATERCDRYARRSWVVIDALAGSDAKMAATAVDTTNLLPRWGTPIQLEGPTVKRVPWGRVQIARAGNRVVAHTTRVARFRLLISPDEFDLTKPILVEVDGKRVFERRVEPSLATLLEWAAIDEDRTMLFAAEVAINVP